MLYKLFLPLTFLQQIRLLQAGESCCRKERAVLLFATNVRNKLHIFVARFTETLLLEQRTCKYTEVE